MNHRAIASVLRNAIAALLLQLPIAAYSQNPEWMVFDTKNAGLPTDLVYSVLVDPQGAVWLSFDPFEGHGIVRYDGQSWTLFTKTNSGLPYNLAAAFGCDKKGNVLILTYNSDESIASARGLVVFDGTTWTVYNKGNSGLPWNNIWGGTVDHQGNTWLGTVAGLARFDGKTWTTFTKEQTGLPSDHIWAMYTDPQGSIWAGTAYGKGLAKFDGEGWTVYTPDPTGRNWEGITDILADFQGNLWLGTFGGLVKFDGVDWTVYTPDNSALPYLNAWSLALDEQGRLWVGSGGLGDYLKFPKGLVQVEGEPWSWPVLTSKNSPLPDDNVFDLKLDSRGNMWIATGKGLAVYREGGVILPGAPTVVQETMEAPLPSAFSLAQNYPNPFNSETAIRFELPAGDAVELAVFDLAGQRVATLVDGPLAAGIYTVRWDGKDGGGGELASGVYLYCLRAGSQVETRKLLLLR